MKLGNRNRNRNQWIGVLAVACLGPAAWADEYVPDYSMPGSQQEPLPTSPEAQLPGSVDQEVAPVSVAHEEAQNSALKNEIAGFKPQAGVALFKSPTDNSDQSRGVLGFTYDMNLTRAALGDEPTEMFLGPSLGLLYSHVGTSNASFWGTGDGSNNQNSGGANLLILPLNLKVGWNASDALRLSVHGGGNIVYRSAANSMNMGSGSDQSGALWKVYPNAGGDVELGLSKSVALLIRPDVTITPENDLFTGTLGVSATFG